MKIGLICNDFHPDVDKLIYYSRIIYWYSNHFNIKFLFFVKVLYKILLLEKAFLNQMDLIARGHKVSSCWLSNDPLTSKLYYWINKWICLVVLLLGTTRIASFYLSVTRKIHHSCKWNWFFKDNISSIRIIAVNCDNTHTTLIKDIQREEKTLEFERKCFNKIKNIIMNSIY